MGTLRRRRDRAVSSSAARAGTNLVDNFRLFGVALYGCPDTFGVASDLTKLTEDAGHQVIDRCVLPSDEDKPDVCRRRLESIALCSIGDINRLDLGHHRRPAASTVAR